MMFAEKVHFHKMEVMDHMLAEVAVIEIHVQKEAVNYKMESGNAERHHMVE